MARQYVHGTLSLCRHRIASRFANRWVHCRWVHCRWVAVCLAIFFAEVAPCHGGVSPENVVVVVNSQSIVSRTVANHYINVREIPSSNVVLLEGVPSDQLKITLDDFKSKILTPVLDQINKRGLAGQISVIAYSADFPTSVDISVDTARLTDPSQIKYQRPTASINGLTYFYRLVLGEESSYLGWGSNLYARGPFERHFANPFGGEKRDRFDEAATHLKEQRGDAAADGFEELFDEHPSLSPLAILAARGHMSSGDRKAAKRMIQRAISAGWWSGTYLRESDELRPLLDDPEINALTKRLVQAPADLQQPIGFLGTRGWTACGHWTPAAEEAMPYMMSCMLAVVHARGSTVPQATAVFDRAALADHSFPDAGFWFTSSSDIRTKTRFPGVGDAISWLKYLNRDTKIIHSPMPTAAGECSGLMLGTATMKLPGSKWSFSAGAISENLTSLSGHFGTDSQTKITELLHAGVALTSGPVAEPYALQYKFPLPIMYGYYASGVTAIEAYYLSVASPYQLLIVGDPLCQPYARPPSDWITSKLVSEPKKHIRISRAPVRLDAPHTDAKKIEVYVEGRLTRTTPAVAAIEIGLPQESSGEIEIRAVLVGIDPTEPRISFSSVVNLDGPRPAPVARVDDADLNANRSAVQVTLEAPGAESILLMHHQELIAEISGAIGTVEVHAKQLGGGPVRLRPVAMFGKQKVLGRSLVVNLATE